MTGSYVKEFPNSFMVFTDGALSCCMERFGGVNSIGLLDVFECENQLYPDRNATPVFSKNNTSVGRELYGPAIKFLEKSSDGEKIIHPNNIELLPFGFLSKNYSMLMADNCMIFKFIPRKKSDAEFIMAMSTLHYKDMAIKSLKNQLVDIDCDWGIRRLPIEFRGKDFVADVPFKDDGMELTFYPPRFENNFLIHSMNQKFAYGDKPLFAVMTANTALSAFNSVNQINLTGAFPEELIFVIAIDSDLTTAEIKARKALENQKLIYRQRNNELKKIEKNAPKIEIEKMPLASEFARVVPLWQNSMMLAETSKAACVRAGGNKFGFFMMWDHIYPIRDFITQNRLDKAEKMLRYVINYPYTYTCVWASSHFIIQLHEFLSFKSDLKLLRDAWPLIVHFMDFVENFEDKNTGFVAAALGVGVDNPQEIGLDGMFFAVCINGWFYDCCCAAENLAYQINEVGFAQKMAEKSAKIKSNYAKYFFDTKAGYLYAGINRNKVAPVKIYQNTNTIGLDYVHGKTLLNPLIMPLAEFQINHLYHPLGRTAVPFDSAAPCEMWKNVHMNQHLGHECKLVRYAGNVAEAYRIMDGYLQVFAQNKVAVETFNLSGCFCDEIQKADWQSFSATAAYNAILQGLCGISWHLGGLFFEAADDCREINIVNLNGFDFSVKGHGGGVKSLRIDGKLLSGSLQIPYDMASFDGKKHTVEIQRCAVAFDRITLLSALDMKVTDLQSQAGLLSFTSFEQVHSEIEFFVPDSRFELLINRKKVQCEKSFRPGCYLYSGRFAAGSIIEIRLL